MSSKTSGVPSKLKAQISRRVRVIKMLTDTLKLGSKISKDGKSSESLTDKDIKRINKELEILKSRI